MKKCYQILKMSIWCLIGVFIGSSMFQYYDYKTHPGYYEWQSAPWYLIIEIRGIFTVILVVILLLVMLMIRKNRK